MSATAKTQAELYGEDELVEAEPIPSALERRVIAASIRRTWPPERRANRWGVVARQRMTAPVCKVAEQSQ